jgi:hypothetical protein
MRGHRPARACRSARETKRPLLPHGAHDASTDEATIRAWWKRWPQANVAIALDGLVVVDVDPRNGAPADRDEIAAMLGPGPETAEAITGGGGRHLYFRARDGLQPPGSLAPGIDVKSGPGAYVVAPPSVHANGRRYTWDGLADPIEALRDFAGGARMGLPAHVRPEGCRAGRCRAYPRGPAKHHAVQAGLRAAPAGLEQGGHRSRPARRECPAMPTAPARRRSAAHRRKLRPVPGGRRRRAET